jgi:hypothetical protein
VVLLLVGAVSFGAAFGLSRAMRDESAGARASAVHYDAPPAVPNLDRVLGFPHMRLGGAPLP